MTESTIGEASTLDGVRFTAQVAVPNVVQGLFRRRKTVTGAAKLVDADKQAVRFYEGLVRKFADEPFFIRVGKDKSVLVHRPEDIRAVLDASPHPFASDPDTKRKGMSHFQPEALTLSRGSLWESRRRFAEAVLETDNPLHSLAQNFLGVAYEAADGLAVGEVTWDAINAAYQRLTRRVVFGDPAADDDELSSLLETLMDEANNAPGKESDSFAPFMAKLRGYVDSAAPGSLSALIAETPRDDDVEPAGQVIHWLFAMGDTLPANVFRALAVLASDAAAFAAARSELADADLDTAKGVAGLSYIAACLQEAMRLWPTTPLFGRVTTTETTLRGATIPEGTQVFIYNTGNHRNRDRIPYADRFAPEEWVTGNAADDWSFNFFSHGTQGCPGAGLAVFLGVAVLARLVGTGTPRIVAGANLRSDEPLPHTVDVFGVRIAIE
ncbi:cytochrome P450 [Antrihabitans sp. YC2-6]|uniref:cytochrome P450 n=1 Tax=Antrihabitans sp. YC2-6 TaxID=2799498 RepID=UPI0018F79622|nr:cytochrome P450 [Antrihabitans sp. YC2-6]MBJ8347476.1 cytochrome P450 [Antrihabitans sp. YC2-6]